MQIADQVEYTMSMHGIKEYLECNFKNTSSTTYIATNASIYKLDTETFHAGTLYILESIRRSHNNQLQE